MAKCRASIGADLTCREAGHQGGVSTLARRGRAYFSLIGTGGQKVFAARYTAEDRSRWGRMGGRPPKPRMERGEGQMQ